MNITEQKRQLRKKMKEIKTCISLSERISRSSLIWSQIENKEIFNSAKTIMVYWSINDEVYTHDFILKWFKKKQIILPCIKDDNLELKVFSGIDDMECANCFGIQEPINENFTDISSIELIIIPGVAFDKQNSRLGRGKGYYDRFLRNTNAYKIGVCFNFQILENIPIDEFDVKMDEVISD